MIKIIEKLLGISKLKAEMNELKAENDRLTQLVELKTFEAERWQRLRYAECKAVDSLKNDLWSAIWNKPYGKEVQDFVHKTAGKYSWKYGDETIEQLKEKYGEDYERLNDLFVKDFGEIFIDNVKKEFTERTGPSL